MTDDDLQHVINAYNGTATFPSDWVVRQLTDTVVYGRVWTSPPTTPPCRHLCFDHYFIIAEDKCVAVVVNMDGCYGGLAGQDLFWYVDPNHRGKGHLHNALHKVILPHLFSDGRESHVATAFRQHAIAYAQRQGFEITRQGNGTPDSPTELVIRRASVTTDIASAGSDRQLTKSESDDLKQIMYDVHQKLKHVSNYLELITGKDSLFVGEMTEDIDRTIADWSMEYPTTT